FIVVLLLLPYTSYSYDTLSCTYQSILPLILFFFQAEDGIRDATVTGVDVCSSDLFGRLRRADPLRALLVHPEPARSAALPPLRRSEERRVGREWRCRRSG